MTKAASEEILRKTWTMSIHAQFGAFKSQGKQRTERKAPFDILIVTCEFEKSAVDMRIVFDDKQSISGWHIRPVTVEVPYTPPAYVRPDTFTERPLTVGAEGWPLPGTLTIPKGAGPFPAVVLVHGSGPGDRDETIGPNKPFRDLAWGLASQGIVVLRYEKRTREHGQRAAKEKNLTIKEETVDDALTGRGRPCAPSKEVDGSRIFVLGHSLGALLRREDRAPRCESGRSDSSWRGNSRPPRGCCWHFRTIQVSVRAERRTDRGDPQCPEKTGGTGGARQGSRTQARHAGPGFAAGCLNVPPYWISLRSYNPTASCDQGCRCPSSCCRENWDYQVTMEDFNGWKKALADRKDVRFKSYPALNHLFMEGKDKATPEEYTQTGHVAAEVITDLAAWIKGR